MIRLSIVALLFVSVFVMMQNIATSWKGKDISVSTVAEKKDASELIPEKVALQPKVPAILPDLKPGYLFNQERLLEGARSAEESGTVEEDVAEAFSIKANINEVQFSGAIIGEKESVALISFPAARRTIKSSRSSKRRRSSSKSMEHARLAVGDVIDGFKVDDIFSDKIVFSKGEEQVEKYLYDPNKKRLSVANKSRKTRSAPSSMAPPSTSSSGRNTRATASQRAASRTATKRMVVERKPPEKPDTSKVSRRRRVVGPQTTPAMPPFMQEQ